MTAPDGLAGPDPAAGLDPAADLDAAAGLDTEASPDTLRELVREVLREVLPVIAGQLNPLNAISTGSQHVERHIERVAGSAPPPAARGLAGPDALRELARQTLRDLLPVVAAADRAVSPVQAIPPGGDVRVNGGILASAAGSAAAGPGGAVRAVRLASDDDLHSFVVEVLRLADDPRRRQEMLAGRLRFTLAGLAGSGHDYTGTSAGWPAASAGTPPTVRRIDKGAVTERAVIAAAKAGERLVLGPRAVLTPLARDKARALGVPVEKER
jgi:hypothetical protein